MIFYDSARIIGMHFRNQIGTLIGAFGKLRYTDLKKFNKLEDYPKEDPEKIPPHQIIKLNQNEDIYGVVASMLNDGIENISFLIGCKSSIEYI